MCPFLPSCSPSPQPPVPGQTVHTVRLTCVKRRAEKRRLLWGLANGLFYPPGRNRSFESSHLAEILGLWGQSGDSQGHTSGSLWHSRRYAPCRKSCGGSFCSLCFALLGTGRTSASPSSASPSPQHSGCPAALDEARAQLEKNEGELRPSGIPSHLRTFPS